MAVGSVKHNFLMHFKGIVLLLILIGGTFHTSAQNQNVCKEEICVNFAQFLNERINKSANICEDFYNYSCGGYVNSENSTMPSPYDQLAHDMENFTTTYFEGTLPQPDPERLHRVARKMYHKCVNLEPSHSDIKELKHVFCWSAVNQTCRNLQRNILEFHRKTRQYGYFSNNFFSLYVRKDKRNRTRQILNIDRPGMQSDLFGSPLEQISLHTSPEAVTNYVLHLLVTELGGEERRIPDIIKDIREFHARVIKAWSSYNPSESYHHTVQVGDLTWTFGQRRTWKDLINVMITPFSVTDDDEVEVPCMTCLKEINDIFVDDRSGAIQYGILGVWLDTIPYAFPKIRNQFITSPQDFCRCALSKFFEKAIDHAYSDIKQSHIDSLKDPINKMFNSLKNQMEKIIKRNTYIQGQSRPHALEKVRALKLYYAVFPTLTYDLALNYIIKESGINQDTNILNATQRLRKSYLERSFIYINNTLVPPGTAKKYFSASSVDIYYDYQEGAVVVPAATLHKYFISPKLPSSVNYGIMGTILAHEMAHAFDTMGRQYNAEGNLFNVFSDAMKHAYRCFEVKYSRFINPETGNQLDGEKLTDESVADTGGAYIAYRRFINTETTSLTLPGFENRSPEALFWISYASRFCSKYSKYTAVFAEKTSRQAPNRFRVNGVVSNIKNFGSDLGCNECSEMNPRWKCNLYHVGNEEQNL